MQHLKQLNLIIENVVPKVEILFNQQKSVK